MTAEDVMTPWKSVICLTVNSTDEEVIDIIGQEGYSRIPVYDEEEDHIIGILHTRDYLLNRGEKDFSLEKILPQPVFVPETVNLDMLFKDMQTDHNHLVIVVNEYGETSGIVSMEDILEEIVGEIWDERDEEVSEFLETGKNTYRVLCTASVEDFFEFFSLEDEETEASTVNGWLTEIAGKIPEEGYCFEHKNLTVTVTKADEFMTHEISVKVNEQVEKNETEDDE